MRLIRKIRRINFDKLILSVAVVTVLILVIGPLFMLVVSSFRTVAPDESGPFTLDNYVEAYLNTETYQLLFNTSLFAIVCLIVAIPIGVLMAWLVERTNAPFRNLAYATIPLTVAMPSMLYGIAWLLLLSPNIGLFNVILMKLLHLKNPVFNPYSITGMGFVEGLRLSSTVFLMTGGVFRGMDPSLEEASLTLGVSSYYTISRITARLMLPGILAAAIYICTTAFDTFEIPAVLGMPRGIHVFATKIYEAANEYPRNYGMASTFGVLLLFFAGLWVFLYGRATRQADAYSTITGKGFRPRVIDLGNWKYLGTAAFLLHFFVIIVAPMSILIWTSFLPAYESFSYDALKKISLTSYLEVLTYPGLWDAMKNTLTLILVAPSLAVILSAVIAWVVVRSKVRGRRVLDALAFMPHGIPGIVMALAFMWLYLRLKFIPIYGTIWIIALAFATRHLAYGTRSMNSAMLQINKELEEAAHVAGATWIKTFYKITIPLLLPSAISMYIWSAMHVIRVLSLALMLYSADSRVLSVMIWDFWQAGQVNNTCAVGVMLMILLGAMLFGGRRLAMKISRQY